MYTITHVHPQNVCIYIYIHLYTFWKQTHVKTMSIPETMSGFPSFLLEEILLWWWFSPQSKEALGDGWTNEKTWNQQGKDNVTPKLCHVMPGLAWFWRAFTIVNDASKKLHMPKSGHVRPKVFCMQSSNVTIHFEYPNQVKQHGTMKPMMFYWISDASLVCILQEKILC